MELSLRARVRAGEPGAFGQLFDDYASTVHRHAVRVTGDWATADDIVSLTFLEAWRLRERVSSEGHSLRPWLLGIATNVMRNITRAQRRHRDALARLPPPAAVPDFADEVARRLADREELAAAHKALSGLRRAEREVFTLCVWEGLDAATAGAALGVTAGTVRGRLSRARKRLRNLTETELKQTAPRTQRPPVGGQTSMATGRRQVAWPTQADNRRRRCVNRDRPRRAGDWTRS